MSLPDAFLDELKQILPPDEIESFLASYEKPLKKSISICTAKIATKALIEITKPRGRHLTPNPFTQPTKSTTSFYIDRDDTSIALGNTFLYQAGFFYIQELAASLPATQIESKPGDLILDMAAAPGGKTTQLAHHLNGAGLVIANEIVSLRLQTMMHNLQQMGTYNTAITQLNGARFGIHLPETFDHVLLDAPCSGEGTKFKSDDALTFWRKEEINKITGLQYQLLVSAIQTVKVGGTIVYSTCTLNPYENEEIIERALSEYKGTIELITTDFHGLSPAVTPKGTSRSFDPTLVSRCRPHRQGTGGFFVAKLRKIAKTNKPISLESSRSSAHRQLSFDFATGGQKKATQRLKDTYGISLDPTHHLLLTHREHIFLCSPDALKLQGVLPFQEIGIPILKLDKEGYRPTHHLGNLLGHLATKNFITLDDEQMQRYSQGEDISHPTAMGEIPKGAGGGFQIVKRRDYGVSVTKLSREGLKNKWGK